MREVIAHRHQALGLATQPEQVHVTNGAQHALDLALGALTKSGDIVAVEDPTYVGVSDLLQRRRLRALPLPLELVDDATHDLTNLVKARRAKALLLVPAVHSPTGKVRHAQQLHALAEQLDLIGLPTIEDNTVADLVFRGKRPPSLASLCHKVPVISVESTSKVGWGGLRVGWVRGPQAVIEATITERSRTDYGTSVPSQLLVIKLLADYDSVVRQRRKALKSSAARFADLMSKHLPDWKWQTPSGGLSAWIDTGTDSEILATQSLRHRVAVATGVSASRSPSARTHIRVCFDRPPVELEAAVVRLARAADDTRGYRA